MKELRTSAKENKDTPSAAHGRRGIFILKTCQKPIIIPVHRS